MTTFRAVTSGYAMASSGQLAISRRANAARHWKGSQPWGREPAARRPHSSGAPGSCFAVLMVIAVLTELTFGAAVSSRMMKF
jgi:hypothetical protein